MPVISVLTPTHRPQRDYLMQCAASVLSQQLPPGWDLEWMLLQDGSPGVITRLLDQLDLEGIWDSQDPHRRIMIGANPHQMGAAVSRNLLLGLCSGELVRAHDHDDILTPGALAADIECHLAHPGLAWCASPTTNLMDDGSLDGWADPPEGPIRRGQLARWWIERDHIIPIHPASVCARREVLLAVGGWAALPPMTEDVGLVVPLNMRFDGWFHNHLGLQYRIWDHQTSADLTEDDPVRQAACQFLDRRIASLYGRFADTDPAIWSDWPTGPVTEV